MGAVSFVLVANAYRLR